MIIQSVVSLCWKTPIHFSFYFLVEPIQAMAENILSKKSKPKFSHDGNIFVFDKCSRTDPSLKFWRCELKNECKGRIHTKNQEVVKLVNEHSHGASSVSVEVAKIKTSVKRKAEETLEVPSSIINVCIAKIL